MGEDKYRKRMIHLLRNDLFYIDGDSYIDTGGEVVIQAGCILAEEVEDEVMSKLPEMYTKQQVEVLLQKQRELSNLVPEDEILLHKIKLD